MKYKLLLINPTGLYKDGTPIKQSKTYLPGLTMLQLAALTPEHYSVKVVSEASEIIPFDEPWDLVGVGGMGGSGMIRGWQIADEFRKRRVPVIMGGIAATLCDKDWTLAHADCIVCGEADEIWKDVLLDFEKGLLKKEYQMQKPPDINNFPVPAYHLLDKRKYGFWRPVQATRGCPYTCTFCSISEFFSQSYRKRNVADVVRDVRAAKASGSKYITFIDDNIGVDFKYCTALWTSLKEEKIIWASQCSLQIGMNPELLKLAYESGCRILSFGVETVNKSSLAHIDKDWNNPENYKIAFQNIKKAGIEISTEMILGIDGDNSTVFKDTFNFIMENEIALPRLYILTPVPGTPLHKQFVNENRIVDFDFSKYNGGDAVFQPKNMSPKELQNGYWKLYNELYSMKNILKRIKNNRANLSPFMRLFVFATNLHYRKHIKKGITPGIV